MKLSWTPNGSLCVWPNGRTLFLVISPGGDAGAIWVLTVASLWRPNSSGLERWSHDGRAVDVIVEVGT